MWSDAIKFIVSQNIMKEAKKIIILVTLTDALIETTFLSGGIVKFVKLGKICPTGRILTQ